MVSSKSKWSKKTLSLSEIKKELALIFTFARQDLRDQFLDFKITTERAAQKLIIERVDKVIKGWFSAGGATTRSPSRWNGLPKTNLITLFP